MKLYNLVAGLMVFAMALPAGAADNKPKTVEGKRFQNQNDAIRRQYQAGNLTEAEADQLRTEQRKIKEKLKTMKADGVLSDEEKAKIDAIQDKARARITLQAIDKEKGKEKTRDKVRQFSEKERIKDGVADGTLTKDEAKDLRKYIQNNAKLIKGSNADGTLTAEEKKRIEARQDILSADIYLKRHNDVNRSPAGAAATGAGPQSVDPTAAPAPTPTADSAPESYVDTGGGVAGFLPADGIH